MNLALPSEPGQNNACLFLLARAVKGIEVQNGPFSFENRVAIFDKWFAKAKTRNVLRPGQGRDEYVAEFCAAYRGVKYPLGLSKLVLEALAAAKANRPLGEADFFESAQAKFLVAICAELQRLAKGAEWFLSARTAGKLIGTSHTTAALYLAMMVDMGRLRITRPSIMRKAHRYEYVPLKVVNDNYSFPVTTIRICQWFRVNHCLI